MIFYTILTLILPITIITIGLILTKKPPKKINDFYGYRTEMSMKNQRTWDYAHRYCGKLWMIFGAVLIALSACFLYLYRNASNKDLSTVVLTIIALQMIVMILSVILVEKSLRKRFDKYGNER